MQHSWIGIAVEQMKIITHQNKNRETKNEKMKQFSSKTKNKLNEH